jgi:hypothetical protein
MPQCILSQQPVWPQPGCTFECLAQTAKEVREVLDQINWLKLANGAKVLSVCGVLPVEGFSSHWQQWPRQLTPERS